MISKVGILIIASNSQHSTYLITERRQGYFLKSGDDVNITPDPDSFFLKLSFWHFSLKLQYF
jgi:hypothetical protein